ncbi:MAG: hypothetical protein K5669_02390 [Lachnospiraceae bacterium]|nr:hypothetical protein [Lachnospiraceae bacterium]
MANKKRVGTILKRYLPVILLELYLGGSYALYRWGVWVYPYQKDNLVLLFVLLYMAALFGGYFLIEKRTSRCKVSEQMDFPHRIYLVLCIVCCLIMVPFCYSKTGSWFPRMIDAFRNLAVAYSTSASAVQAAGVLHYFGSVGSFIVLPVFVISYRYWESLKLPERIISSLILVWFFSVEIATGHNRGIFFYMAVLFVVFLSVLFGNKINKRIVLKKMIVALLFVIFFVVYFYLSLSSRNSNTIAEVAESDISVKEIILSSDDAVDMIIDEYGYVEEHDSQNKEEYASYEDNYESAMKINPYYADEFMHAYVDTNHFLYKLMPGKMKFLLVLGSSYLTQGYHGVSLGVHQSYTPSWGCGTFLFLRNKIKGVTGIDLYKNTLIYKINENGYPISLKWGTAFTQWASDVSFIGIVFMMFLAGMLFATLWIDSIEERNIGALIFLCVLTFFSLMFISWWLPGMSGGDFMLFHGYLAFWGVTSIIRFLKIKKG